jgi:hypothetical protein
MRHWGQSTSLPSPNLPSALSAADAALDDIVVEHVKEAGRIAEVCVLMGKEKMISMVYARRHNLSLVHQSPSTRHQHFHVPVPDLVHLPQPHRTLHLPRTVRQFEFGTAIPS